MYQSLDLDNLIFFQILEIRVHPIRQKAENFWFFEKIDF